MIWSYEDNTKKVYEQCHIFLRRHLSKWHKMSHTHTYLFQRRRIYKGKKHSAWVAHLDEQKKKTKHVSDSSVRKGIKKLLKNQKYTCQELLSVIRDKSWKRKNNNIHYQRKNLPHTKLQKKTLLSTIPLTLASLLQPNIMMEGHDIEDFVSLLIATNANMSFITSHFDPNSRQYEETY
jgi:hypothetical protein